MPNNKERQSYKRRRKKRSPVFGLLSFLIVCAAMVFGMSVFFRVSAIEVLGTGSYSEEEIIEASELQVGDNLFFVNRMAVENKIYAKLPYVRAASVSRKLPNRIVIDITESEAIAALTDAEGQKWAIDSSCKLLSQITAADAAALIRIDGSIPHEPQVGDVFKSEDGANKAGYLAEILSCLSAREMHGDVTKIDMSNIGSPSFSYLGRFTVKLGDYQNVDYKMELLLSAVSQLKAGDYGTIDLSADKRANFTPD